MRNNNWFEKKRESGLKRVRHAWRSVRVFCTNHAVSGIVSRRMRMWWYRHVMGYVVGKGTAILPDFRVSEPSGIIIGDNTIINNSCRFDNRCRIVIGDNVSVSYAVTILTMGHDIDSPDFAVKGGDVVVEDLVWLCARCMIMPGVRVGRGAVVLPGSIVTADVAPFSVVGGNPAQFVRKRNENLRYKLSWNPRVPMLG